MHNNLASLSTLVTPVRPLLFCKRVAVVLAVLLVISTTIQPTDWASASTPTVQGDERFGINWINPPNQLASTTRMGQAVNSGARWDRFPFYWNEIQAEPHGYYDFANLDKTVNHDIANGFKIQGILLGAPQWAVATGSISMTDWEDYVTKTVSHFKGRVDTWEIWNEPDLLGANGGVFWHWSVADYYQLMKVGYLATKNANPNATVVIGALAFPDNNRGFFPTLLQEIAADSSAANNNHYFDVLSLHMYTRSSTIYDLPVGYVGTPEFAGFHNLMRSRGFDKPIWITETGVSMSDSSIGTKGHASASDHASYIIQAFAYALAADVDKVFVFQLYDDGAVASGQTSGALECYGLVANGGQTRSGYSAYQTAARYFSSPQVVTRVNMQRDGSADVKGIDVITMYGTPNGKVTVIWNNDGSPNQSVRILSNTSRAILVNKFGNQQAISASNGYYTINLAAANNSSNPNSRPNDFIIGGEPVILVEADSQVPATVVKALPSGVRAPFSVNWSSTREPYSALTYDVQYMDASTGIWRTWINGTTATSAQFGTNGTSAQLNHTYVFRVRARDAAGNLFGGDDFPLNGMASTVVLGGTVTGTPSNLPVIADEIVKPSQVDGRIQLVWPQGNLPVSGATKANIGAYLFDQSNTISVNQSFDHPVALYRAVNAGIEEKVSIGTKTSTTKNHVTFPVWEFNDIDVSVARDPNQKIFFRIAAEGIESASNVWAHGSDARTIFPKTDIPTDVLRTPPAIVDGKIEIVWPHGGLPVNQATQANIGVYLFGHGGLQSVPITYDGTVKLLRTLNTGVEEKIATGTKAIKTENGITYPVWQFNDIDVSAARDGSTQYYFRVAVDGVNTYSNVWVHGKDARTIFPTTDTPSGVLP